MFTCKTHHTLTDQTMFHCKRCLYGYLTFTSAEMVKKESWWLRSLQDGTWEMQLSIWTTLRIYVIMLNTLSYRKSNKSYASEISFTLYLLSRIVLPSPRIKTTQTKTINGVSTCAVGAFMHPPHNINAINIYKRSRWIT